MPTFTHLDDLHTFLSQTTDYEKMVRYRMKRGAFDLGRVERFFDALGAPQTSFECVHVAGTTGKGSVTWMIDGLLREHGVLSGRYTSPHLERENERIAIGGNDISEGELLDVFNEMAPVLERFQGSGDALTYFEIMTGAALVAFRRAGVKIAVLETGLGGRLDATNVVMPALTIITNVGYDHMDKLGETLEDIAYEKSGVIKRAIPLITGNYEHEALDYVLARAKDEEAPVHKLDTHFRVQRARPVDEGYAFDVNGQRYEHRDIVVPMPAAYQTNNAAMAIEALHELHMAGLVERVDDGAVRLAMAKLRIPGRCEIFTSPVPTMLDSGHNIDSIRQCLRTFQARFAKHSRKVLLFAVNADKDVESVVKLLANEFDEVVLTETPSPRTAQVDELATLWLKQGVATQSQADLHDAFDVALSLCDDRSALLITGSFYLAGPLRSELVEMQQSEESTGN